MLQRNTLSSPWTTARLQYINIDGTRNRRLSSSGGSSGGVVWALAVQGDMLASGGTDNLIEIWDLLTELVFTILETGRMYINALAFPSQPVKNERLILSLRK